MHSNPRRLVGEAVGTFFLVLVGAGAVMVDSLTHGGLGDAGIALAFAFVILAMVAALGHVSGAHINPAVTLAFWSVRRFPAAEVFPYIGAQCLGAVAASVALRLILGDVGMAGATLPVISAARALVVEFLLSFVLMLVIMGVATDTRADPGVAPLAIGLTVGFCALVGGPLTGASMNPARSLGPALIGGHWQAHWIFWVGPIAGMSAAAILYEWLRPVTDGAATPRSMIATGVEGPIPN